jgi:DNA-binding response OmpR family regulator
LPDVQGTDVCLTLKQEQPSIAVILLGPESKQERFVGNEVGADAFLVEPVESAKLVEKVREVFSATLVPR